MSFWLWQTEGSDCCKLPLKKNTLKKAKKKEATVSSAAAVVCFSELDGIFLSGIYVVVDMWRYAIGKSVRVWVFFHFYCQPQ